MQDVPTLRMLIANEPRTYREVLAATFQRLRPDMMIQAVEPERLDHEVLCFAPHLIVCSQLTGIVNLDVHAWVVLYPDGQSIIISQIAGCRVTISDVSLDGLLDIIERIEQRALVEL